MAKAHNQMELYADIIGSDATSEDYINIANYFEEAGNHFLAGKFFLKAQRYDKVYPYMCFINTQFPHFSIFNILFFKNLNR